ncbi:nuclear transport factor 2 family protein [Nocardia yamanashiensis]|uniref:nuclear transport factor 2 family protein n=1 Tax=Nocardia yamanashiensis TaxID=209247 RepID=UPI001E5F5C23|nr:nuclear transport factor 2 family protein [Nocardia yamanashiensis]UGT44840.1 nuclear transport factor 2 family protein [Nocardia yamanashiensis]
MTSEADLTTHRIAIIRRAFELIDAGDPALLDLYTDDVELFFPKFGVGQGKQDMAEFARRLWLDLSSIEHDIDGLDYMVAGDRIIVEGRERGTTADGRRWPDQRVSTGRFCNVFTFRGTLISAVHIYVDPDFTSSHQEKVRQLHHGEEISIVKG